MDDIQEILSITDHAVAINHSHLRSSVSSFIFTSSRIIHGNTFLARGEVVVNKITWILSVSSSEISNILVPKTNLELGSLNYCRGRRPKQRGVMKEEGEMEWCAQLQSGADWS